MGTLITTVTESIRYRGRSGQYTWLAHRLAGLGILAFLVIHVWDTANASFAPNVYAWTIEVFKTLFSVSVKSPSLVPSYSIPLMGYASHCSTTSQPGGISKTQRHDCLGSIPDHLRTARSLSPPRHR